MITNKNLSKINHGKLENAKPIKAYIKYSNPILTQAKHNLDILKAKLNYFESNIFKKSNNNLVKYKNVELDLLDNKIRQDKPHVQIKGYKSFANKLKLTESGYDKFSNTDFSTHFGFKADSINLRTYKLDEDDSFSDMSDIIDDILCIRDNTIDEKSVIDNKTTSGSKIDKSYDYKEDILQFINEYENEASSILINFNRINHVDSMTIEPRQFKRNKNAVSMFNLVDKCDNIIQNVISDAIVTTKLDCLENTFNGCIAKRFDDNKLQVENISIKSKNLINGNNLKENNSSNENNTNELNEKYSLALQNNDTNIEKISNKILNVDLNIKESDHIQDIIDEDHEDSKIIDEIIKNSNIRFLGNKENSNALIFIDSERDRTGKELILKISDNSINDNTNKKVYFGENTYIGYLDNFNVKNILIIDSEGNFLENETKNRKRNKPYTNKSFIIKPIIKTTHSIKKSSKSPFRKLETHAINETSKFSLS